ncbi:hypothetical protein EV193_102256 [Herbihabitans rhizosphaerae]|uniref:Uncharacterized protein n=1 Tax=Herbihabitans rhizosphaerae TaxID=1872711 RepID=A0A4Q7L246_9PSEU|nr:hypothetical protein EV193_102256 [Herbihabitans rhizosphaerae]
MVWTSAWLHGAAAADDVLDASQEWGELHEVVVADQGTATALDLPTRDEPPAALAMLLAALRQYGASAGRIVLPVPGDVRGLDGKSEFAAEAIRVGDAAVFAGLGLVPDRVADGVVRWTVYDLPVTPPQAPEPIGAADRELSEAMRAAAGTLASLDVARDRPNVRAEIAERVASTGAWPAAMPQRSLRVLQRANELAAILELAAEDEPGGAVSASAALQRADALRPLSDAVRAARRAAVQEAVSVLTDHADRH